MVWDSRNEKPLLDYGFRAKKFTIITTNVVRLGGVGSLGTMNKVVTMAPNGVRFGKWEAASDFWFFEQKLTPLSPMVCFRQSSLQNIFGNKMPGWSHSMVGAYDFGRSRNKNGV